MKKTLFICAIILLNINLFSCTPESLSNDTELQLTVGEEENPDVDPDGING
ncbi:hypothetical protein JYU05_00225 [bacterium AH-315-P13]|nr:hypothetical protein [bacterium AH-315-P13]